MNAQGKILLEYARNLDNLKDKSQHLNDFVQRIGEQTLHEMNWAHVGDLRHANERLEELLKFLRA